MTEPFNNQSTQDKRRETLENDKSLREQQRGSTLSQFAQGESDAPLGRFSAHEKSVVIGSVPSAAAQYPAGPAWSATQLPDEPPLGVSIEDHQAVGEAHEIAKSLGEAGPSPGQPDGEGRSVAVASNSASSERPRRTQSRKRRK